MGLSTASRCRPVAVVIVLTFRERVSGRAIPGNRRMFVLGQFGVPGWRWSDDTG